MNSDLEVDTDDLRRTAAAVAGTATRVTAGTWQEPFVDGTPRWATADAAALAADAAREQLAVLGADIADIARRMVEAAAAYEAADDRAAARLRSAR